MSFSHTIIHLKRNLTYHSCSGRMKPMETAIGCSSCPLNIALNISKTNFILFRSSKLKPSQSLRIEIDGTLIKQVDPTKYLGITFDSNLTWKSHINELCLKLSKTVGILSKVRHFVDNHILVMLYYSLIYPFLTYGVHVWGLTFPSFLTQLSIVQKKAIRIKSFSEPKSHSEPLFKSLNLT